MVRGNERQMASCGIDDHAIPNPAASSASSRSERNDQELWAGKAIQLVKRAK